VVLISLFRKFIHGFYLGIADSIFTSGVRFSLCFAHPGIFSIKTTGKRGKVFSLYFIVLSNVVTPTRKALEFKHASQ